MAEEILETTETETKQQEISEAFHADEELTGEAGGETEAGLQQGEESGNTEAFEDTEDILEGKYPHDEENRNKKMRNKAPAFIFDYWKTNRDTERENMRRQEEEGTADKPWSRNEKIYLAVIVICVVLLAVKYGPVIIGGIK